MKFDSFIYFIITYKFFIYIFIYLKKCNLLIQLYRKRKCFVGDFKHVKEIDSPNSRLTFWNASHRTVESQRKRMKFLNKQNAILTKKVKTLEDLVKHLKDEKKMISDNCFTVLKVCII